MNYYILKNGKIKKCSLEEWFDWWRAEENRRIDLTDISNLPNYPGGQIISTVFLGIDHNFNFTEFDEEHVPILFETMVFGGKYSGRAWRYSSYGEAKRGHWIIVDQIRNGNPPEVKFGERPSIELFLEMFKDDEEEETDE